MLVLIEEIRKKTSMPYQSIVGAVGLPYGSFLRWRARRTHALPLVRQPGPAKVQAPDFDRLQGDIGELSHGRHRTQGTGALYARYASFISRRALQSMVEAAKHDTNSAHRQNMRRIRWNVPNVAWSMDPCEYGTRNAASAKVYVNQMQDMASRYKFPPMAGSIPCGEEISGYLAATFTRFGPPLFLKRDNGGNLNHTVVNDVLADYFVMPVNSPASYPPYNGAIEKAQSELKGGLAVRLSYKPSCPREHLEAYASAVEHDLNHKPRASLKGSTACQVYFAGRKTFSKWERRDAYAWITEVQDAILCREEVRPQAAWRIAVEAWLKMKSLITVTVNGKVLPNFC